MAKIEKTCQIETSEFSDGFWHVRASIKIGPNNYSSTHSIEGAENLGEADLVKAVLALY